MREIQTQTGNFDLRLFLCDGLHVTQTSQENLLFEEVSANILPECFAPKEANSGPHEVMDDFTVIQSLDVALAFASNPEAARVSLLGALEVVERYRQFSSELLDECRRFLGVTAIIPLQGTGTGH